jgi:hypothetical protein
MKAKLTVRLGHGKILNDAIPFDRKGRMLLSEIAEFFHNLIETLSQCNGRFRSANHHQP